MNDKVEITEPLTPKINSVNITTENSIKKTISTIPHIDDFIDYGSRSFPLKESADNFKENQEANNYARTVSYTHLTLPTNREV